jgi:hypothetical protein
MREIQRIGVLVAVLLAGSQAYSQAAIAIHFPNIVSGGGVATSATFSTFVTLGQPVVGVAAGSTLAVVSGLAPSVAGSTVEAPPVPPPGATGISRIMPNPFTRRIAISLDIARGELTALRVFDIDGRLIRTLINRRLEPGTYSIEWDGTALQGVPVGAGMYFCRFQSGAITETRRLVLIK